MLTNRLGLPKPFVDAATSDHQHIPRRYSVTEVLGGTCEAVLKRRHAGEQDEDVSDRVWAILGTAVHRVLQDAQAGPGQLQEGWMSVDVGDGYEMSGIFDLYDATTATVTDYKTCSVWKAMVGDYDDWRRQVLLYCWMLRRKGIEAHSGEVVAIMRDHSMRKARTESGYPKHPVVRLGWTFTAEDFERAESHVISWFENVREQEDRADSELIPCSPESRWSKPARWAVCKAGRKRAVRLLPSEQEALDYMDRLIDRDGAIYHMEFRHGEDTKCESYCSVSEFCPWRKIPKIPEILA